MTVEHAIELNVPPFQGLEPEHLELIRGCASRVKFPAEAYLFRQGDEADACYIITQGKAALEIHAPQGPIIIQTLEDSETLGWSWLFPPYTWHFDARAVTLVRAVKLDATRLRGELEKNPVLGYQLMKRFSKIMHQRMQAARIQLLDLYGAEK